MRNRSTPLLVLPAMVLLAPACMGQARDPAPAATEKTATPAADSAEPAPRSAFGQVMEVMIDALREETRNGAGAGRREVRTTASGTPLGIEVGSAFRLDHAPPADADRPLAVQSGD